MIPFYRWGNQGQRNESLDAWTVSLQPLPLRSWETRLWSWVDTKGVWRGGRRHLFAAGTPPPVHPAWVLPPTLVPASPSYLKIIKLLGRLAKQTDAELSVIGFGSLDGGLAAAPAAAPTLSTQDQGRGTWPSPARWSAKLYPSVAQVKGQGGGITIKCQRKGIRPLPPATFQSLV